MLDKYLDLTRGPKNWLKSRWRWYQLMFENLNKFPKAWNETSVTEEQGKNQDNQDYGNTKIG